MESGVSLLHSQELSNNPHPETESTQFLVLTLISLRSVEILSSHLRVGLPVGLLPAKSL